MVVLVGAEASVPAGAAGVSRAGETSSPHTVDRGRDHIPPLAIVTHIQLCNPLSQTVFCQPTTYSCGFSPHHLTVVACHVVEHIPVDT